jgi:RNA polymerase sigma-70 factor (ECF subfamily)
LALKKIEYCSAAKRNPNAVCSLNELSDCVSGKDYIEDELENKRIEQAISEFLSQQSQDRRTVFLWRYWYFESIESICRRTGYSQSKVTSMLFRTRKNLCTYLESEGIEL